jgi:hypothetical protein
MKRALLDLPGAMLPCLTLVAILIYKAWAEWWI